MSNHGICYLICPDDTTEHTDHEWKVANDFCVEYRKDWNEAIALAKIASISCNFPFIVQEHYIRGKGESFANTWVVNRGKL